MVLHKTQFFKACVNISFTSDVKLLWSAFHKDDLGSLSLEEIDPPSAQVLANFRSFIMTRYGSAAAGFRKIDKANKKQLGQQEFVSRVKELGYRQQANFIFIGLKRKDTKYLVRENLDFLDHWSPPAYLLSDPN